jgi:hypothetical protein
MTALINYAAPRLYGCTSFIHGPEFRALPGLNVVAEDSFATCTRSGRQLGAFR